jgi:elongation factor G
MIFSGDQFLRNTLHLSVKGFTSMMDNGMLAGYHIDSMKVRLYDGQTHAVDSKPLAFELCAKEGFKEASKKCNPVLLEPIMKLKWFHPMNM